MTTNYLDPRKVTLCVTALCSLVLALGLPSKASAYDRYTQNTDSTNCGACHGANFRQNNYTSLVDFQSWGNLHDLHRNTMLGGDCNTCHSGGNRFPVFTNSSNGGNGLSAISCVGCHGRTQDDTNANPDFPNMGGLGAGLRQHHYTAGVTLCANCHQDADPLNYTPVGENVLPDYYANPGTGHGNMPVDSCNPNGSENFAGAVDGLDNDGDGNADGADSQCGVGVCGDGNVDPGEDCDDMGESATCDSDCTFASCGDGTVNTTASETCDDAGESATCDANCTAATCGDGTVNMTAGEDCDDAGESATCDSDCTSVACGDSVINTSAGEVCDPSSSCPSSCDDNNTCTTDTMSGTPQTCDAVCSNTVITACVGGDGCCASGCDATNDNDCSDTCGNGTLEPGETCDPQSSCPTDCNDNDACTSDTLTGSAANCNAECANQAISMCTSGDGCCPSGCTTANDDDCATPPGDGGGCGCSVGSRRSSTALAGLLFLGLALVAMRRRKKSRHS